MKQNDKTQKYQQCDPAGTGSHCNNDKFCREYEVNEDGIQRKNIKKLYLCIIICIPVLSILLLCIFTAFDIINFRQTTLVGEWSSNDWSTKPSLSNDYENCYQFCEDVHLFFDMERLIINHPGTDFTISEIDTLKKIYGMGNDIFLILETESELNDLLNLSSIKNCFEIICEKSR